MRLTKTQEEKFESMRDALQRRKPVLITGSSNGKTTLMHQALEVLGQRDERTGGYSSEPSHPEDFTIDYFTRIYFPSSDKITLTRIMKQVLQFAGEHVPVNTGEALVVQLFDKFMTACANENRMVTLAIDNAELLPAKAYVVLKALHEYRDVKKRRTIGTGLMIGGTLKQLKRMPYSFQVRCHEVALSRITADEISDLIEALYPGRFRLFSANSIKSIAKCKTTSEIRELIEHCITYQSQYKLRSIEYDLVEERMAGMSLAA
jgi:hypothetical protein